MLRRPDFQRDAMESPELTLVLGELAAMEFDATEWSIEPRWTDFLLQLYATGVFLNSNSSSSSSMHMRGRGMRWASAWELLGRGNADSEDLRVLKPLLALRHAF